MASLLGNGFDDPQSAAIMALAGGLLRRDFGGGLLAANSAFGEAKQTATRQQLAQMQMEAQRLQLDKAKRDAANEQGLQGLMPQFFSPGTQGAGGTASVNEALPPEFRIGAMPPIPAKAPGFDVKGYTAAALSKGYMNPLDAIKLQQAMAKDTPINKVDVKDFSPASVQKFLQTGNYADLQRMDKLHFADSGGTIAGLDPFTGRPVNSIPKTGNPFNDLLVADGKGGMQPNSPLIAAKTAIARAGAPSVTVDTAPKTFWGDFGKATSDALFKEREGAQAAAGTLQSIGEIRKAVAGGAFQGSGAELKLSVAKALNSLGATIDPQTVANTELFNANAKGFVLNQIKSLGTNPSNADREFIEQTVPRLQTDPNALPKLLNFMEVKARQQVDGFNTKIRTVQKQPMAQGMPPISLEVQAPEPTGPIKPNFIWKDGKLVPAN